MALRCVMGLITEGSQVPDELKPLLGYLAHPYIVIVCEGGNGKPHKGLSIKYVSLFILIFLPRPPRFHKLSQIACPPPEVRHTFQVKDFWKLIVSVISML